MLVLTRKKNEIINIGNDVKIMVVEIRQGKVRLGITAPRELQVYRNEVTKAIEREALKQAS